MIHILNIWYLLIISDLLYIFLLVMWLVYHCYLKCLFYQSQKAFSFCMGPGVIAWLVHWSTGVPVSPNCYIICPLVKAFPVSHWSTRCYYIDVIEYIIYNNFEVLNKKNVSVCNIREIAKTYRYFTNPIFELLFWACLFLDSHALWSFCPRWPH